MGGYHDRLCLARLGESALVSCVNCSITCSDEEAIVTYRATTEERTGISVFWIGISFPQITTM